MNRHITLLALLMTLTTGTLYAQSCYQVKADDIKVSWTAYKTPAKAGVSGMLPKVTYTGAKTEKTIDALIQGASVTIDANKVATKNPARDKKISNFFFGNMKGGKTIKAKVTSFTKKYLRIELDMNKKKRIVPMTYTLENNVLKATGYLDVLDLMLGKSLAAINKACFAMHQGKTWSDVQLNLEVKLSNCK